MSDVVANPEQIEALALMLRTFAQETGDGLGRVTAMLDELEQSGQWNDAVERAFRARFEVEVQQPVAATVAHIGDELVPFLVQLAERLRAYLERG